MCFLLHPKPETEEFLTNQVYAEKSINIFAVLLKYQYLCSSSKVSKYASQFYNNPYEKIN